MARGKYDKDKIAEIVAEAAYTNVHKVAEKYNVSSRSVQRWRHHAEYDAELAKLVLQKKRAFQSRWVEEAGAFIQQGFVFLRKAANNENLSPEMIHAIAGAMKIAGEIVTMREILDARLAGQDRANNPQD